MQSISTIGLDIAKSIFQVHGIGAASQWLPGGICSAGQVAGGAV